MFKPRYIYRSPITHRYRGQTKGCPVFNNLDEITSDMVEEHDECLECLAKLKNRIDLYNTLAENNKPSNTVIKSLQRLSSSTSNNRLKTCLQFLIIKVNEKSSNNKREPVENGARRPSSSTTNETVISNDLHEAGINKPTTKRQKLSHQQKHFQYTKHNDLASPPQDQVSSTQDQITVSLDDHECQTSPSIQCKTRVLHDNAILEEQQTPQPSSPDTNVSPQMVLMTSTSTSPVHLVAHLSDDCRADAKNSPNPEIVDDGLASNSSSSPRVTFTTSRARTRCDDDDDSTSIPSWSAASFGAISPPSPQSSTSSEASISSIESLISDTSDSSSCYSCSELSMSYSPEALDELKGPRLKLNEDKIRRITKRPVLFDEIIESYEQQPPSTISNLSKGDCFSPGQQSISTQNSDQTSGGMGSGLSSLSSCNTVVHMFQAPPSFVNTLRLVGETPPSTRRQEGQPLNAQTEPKVELLRCAICGIKEKSPAISKIHGQYSCVLCSDFFTSFLNEPQQLYCAQDGDCLMAFDSRCQACWIKICLQKFTIDEQQRKIGQEYSPKLLSSPSIALLTIDTSATG